MTDEDDVAETEFSYGQYDVSVYVKPIRSATGAMYRLVNVAVSNDGAYRSRHSTKTMLAPGDVSERILFPLIQLRDTQDPRAQVRETVERALSRVDRYESRRGRIEDVEIDVSVEVAETDATPQLASVDRELDDVGPIEQ